MFKIVLIFNLKRISNILPGKKNVKDVIISEYFQTCDLPVSTHSQGHVITYATKYMRGNAARPCDITSAAWRLWDSIAKLRCYVANSLRTKSFSAY